MSEVFEWVLGVAAVVCTLAVLAQMLILALTYRAVMEAQKAGKAAEKKFSPLIDRFGPLLDRFEALITSSGKILEENMPRISEVTTETVAIVKKTRVEVDRVSELIDDFNARAKTRIAQIDQTVDHTVGQVEHAGEAVRSAVLRPVKEVNGLVAGVKAAFSTYAQGGNRHSPENATQDEAMFI